MSTPHLARRRLLRAAAAATTLPPLWLLHRHYDDAIESWSQRLSTYQRVAAQAPELTRALDAMRARDGRRYFLRNTAANLAGAELQEIVKAAIEGNGVTKLNPVIGFVAQTSSTIAIEIMTALGAPVSTTQVVTTSIMGAGSARRFSSVRWGVARKIIGAWFITLPITIVLGGACAWIIGLML